jgi:hypothetical protein
MVPGLDLNFTLVLGNLGLAARKRPRAIPPGNMLVPPPSFDEMPLPTLAESVWLKPICPCFIRI